MKNWTLAAVMIMLAGCGQAPTRQIASTPSLGEEVVPPEEAAATAEILALIGKGYSHYRPADKTAGRIIHHKEHGCVKAEFKVLENLPTNLRVGVFAQVKTFPAWVRVSNGSGSRQHDSIPDARGFAVKLMNVDGDKLGDEVSTQDFLLQSAPNFFAKDVAAYVKFMKMSAQPGFKGVSEFFKDVKIQDRVDRESLGILLHSSDQPSNPLTTEYFSALPQKLGTQAMKLKVQACKDINVPEAGFTTRLKKDFLKAVMTEHLSQMDACVEFLVQVQTDALKMPIENAMVTWDPELSPFVPVARILIPKQKFTSEKRSDFCENVSFTPWHTIPEHRPLGGLNRVRKLVYEHSLAHRHKLNNQRSFEPKAGELYE
jgi:hypothetical protein